MSSLIRGEQDNFIAKLTFTSTNSKLLIFLFYILQNIYGNLKNILLFHNVMTIHSS